MQNTLNISSLPSALGQAGASQVEFTSASLALREVPGVSIARAQSMRPAAQAGWPQLTGRVTGGDPAMLCVRPGDWLLISEAGAAGELLDRASEQADAAMTLVHDHSDGLALFRLSGAGAPWLLNKLSGLDFQSGVNSGPHCARTRLGHVAAVVHYHELEPGSFVFDLVFDRSVAKYLWELLTASVAHADELAAGFGAAS